MKILFVTNLYPPQELGGYGRSMADFAWGLIQKGHYVEVLTSNAPYLSGDFFFDSGQGPSGEVVHRKLKLKVTQSVRYCPDDPSKPLAKLREMPSLKEVQRIEKIYRKRKRKKKNTSNHLPMKFKR